MNHISTSTMEDGLTAIGWTKEGAQFLISHQDNNSVRILLRRVFGGFPYRRKPSNKAKIPATLRWAVWERDNFTCQRCGSRKFLSIDHIKPESKGGTLDPDNLQTLCKRCNAIKRDR